MLKTETRYAIDPESAKTLDTTDLRRHFHVDDLFAGGEIRLVYSHYDRLILGSAVPGTGSLTLDAVPETGTPSFLDRREMGVLNIGETGTVSVGGEDHTLENGEVSDLIPAGRRGARRHRANRRLSRLPSGRTG